MPESRTHIVDVVRQWEDASPNEVAVRFGEKSWTWSEFASRIRRHASAQTATGLTPGERVAFLDKNHPACLETTLACALAGTVNAVVNFRLAPAELAYVINDCGPRLLFVGAEFLPVVEEIRPQLATVDRVIAVGADDDPYERFLAEAPEATAGRAAQPGDCFLQLYTSGTTGRPKGVMLTHRSVTAAARAARSGGRLDRDSVSMVAMPLFHVSGTSWALGGMSAGAQTVIVRDVVPGHLLEQFARDRITHAFLVPAVFGFLLGAPGVADHDYGSLRVLAYGGSPMPAPLLRQAMRTFSSAGFVHVYGMTEASGGVSALGPEDHRDPDHPERLLSVGLPVEGVEMRVTDPGTREVAPDGQLGEIEVRGEVLMDGYWQRPADTAGAVVDGWLRTGDAGRRDSHGYFYVDDRVTDMIISGGENIYPAEVERVLAEHPDVAEVAVIGVPDDTWGETVKAVVVPRSGSAVDAAALREHCRPRLAGYKRPSSVDVVDSLPRNATGKILKHAIRAPYWAGRDRAI